MSTKKNKIQEILNKNKTLAAKSFFYSPLFKL